MQKGKITLVNIITIAFWKGQKLNFYIISIMIKCYLTTKTEEKYEKYEINNLNKLNIY